MSRLKKITYIILTFSIGILLSCSQKTSSNILSRIFSKSVDSTKTDSNDNLKDKILVVDELDDLYFHEPYQQKQCNECHEQDNKSVKGNITSICYSCHTNYNSSHAILHGPLNLGNCDVCHDPHKSKYKALLIRNEAENCFWCHDQEEIQTNEIHTFIDNTACFQCHDPHGDENKYFLNSKACNECHDNFENTFKYVHGPVQSGLCHSCHEMHDSDNEYKLIKTGQDLCFECHYSDRLLKTETHKETGDFDCLECHHPHGGEDNTMLR
jgi:predicted CXXCH cytochrome family protein